MYYSSSFKDWIERFKPYLIIGFLSFLIILFLFLSIKTTLRYFIRDYDFHLGEIMSVTEDVKTDSVIFNIFQSELKGKRITPTVYYQGYASATYMQGNELKLSVHSDNDLIQDYDIICPLNSVPIFNASSMRMENPDNFVAASNKTEKDVRVFFDSMTSSSPQVVIINEKEAGKKLLCLKIERAVFNYDLQELQIVSSYNNAKVTITNPMGITSALSGDLVYADSISRGDYIVFDASMPDSEIMNIDASGKLVSDASKKVSDKGLVGEVGNYIATDDNTYYYDYITYTVDNAVVF